MVSTSFHRVRCEACGASEPVSPEESDRGYRRCGFCRTVAPLPLGDDHVLVGPRSRVVALTRPGRLHVIVEVGTLLKRWEVAAWIVLTVLVAGLFGGTFELNEPGAVRTLGVSGGVVLLIGGVLATLRRATAEQHLLVGPGWVEAWWQWKRRRTRPRRVARDDLARPEVAAGNAGRHVLRISTGRPGPTLQLFCSGEREAGWASRVLDDFLSGGRLPRPIQCPGCGARLASSMIARADGQDTCPFCRSGFVLDGEAAHLAPAVVPLPRALDPAAPSALRLRRGRPGLVVGLTPILAYGLVLFGGLGGFMLYATRLVPDGTVLLPMYMAVGGAALVLCALGWTVVMLSRSAGGVNVSFQEGRLSWHLTLFGRRVPWDADTVPLFRIVQVESVDTALGSDLHFDTPQGRRTLSWWSPAAERAATRDRILSRIRVQLESLSRPIAPEPAESARGVERTRRSGSAG